jgi:putative transposase
VISHTRRLPHLEPTGAEFFVTWRLFGSLPKAAHGAAPQLAEQVSAGAAFVAFDRLLDRAARGPLWLKDPVVANVVSGVLLAGASDWRLYELSAWVIMANHVHVLIRPQVPLGKALMNIKSASAREANAVLGRTGRPFWQDESYDHFVRNDRERAAIIRYIHLNPVMAGFVAEPEDWPWTSARWQRMAPPHIQSFTN